MNTAKPIPAKITVLLGLCILFAAMFLTGHCFASDGQDNLQVAPLRLRTEEVLPRMGFVPPQLDLSHIRAPMPTATLSLPTRFDWREAGKVTPVKSQGHCGSCYAFASIANFESRLLIEGEGAFDLSENNVKECEWFGSSCGGGDSWIVANFLSTHGSVLEACDPYVPRGVNCKTGCEYQKTLLDWRVISGDSPAPVDVLKTYIQTYGPVYTAMYAGNYDAWYSEFASYDGSYTMYPDGQQIPNHAVLIIGWDDNLVHDGGRGGWIVKNSWGTSWGGACGYGSERGYFTIGYGSASIGTHASFVGAWQDYDPQSTLLYYDEGGGCGSFGYGSKTAWGLCKFIPSEDRFVERVEFWTTDVTVDVDIYIYDDFDGSNTSNLLASSQDNSYSFAGYHSVKLPSPLPVKAGDDIYAVAKITNAVSNYPMPYDHAGPEAPGYCYTRSNETYYMEFPLGDLGIRLRLVENVSCYDVEEAPVIVGIADVPEDEGGSVEVSWKRCIYDEEDSSPSIETYRIWRWRRNTMPLVGLGDEEGPRISGPYQHDTTNRDWEVVATVSATGQCLYRSTVPTQCDSCSADTCWAYFCVTAHTDSTEKHFDSPIARGYSIDNRATQQDPPLAPGDGQMGAGATILSIPEPNPGSDGFVLRFELGQPDWLQIDIYDVTGRKVAVLLDDFAQAGSHEISWRTGSGGVPKLSPGLYFVRLVTTSDVHTVKLMLMR